jgi:hypothetical protein
MFNSMSSAFTFDWSKWRLTAFTAALYLSGPVALLMLLFNGFFGDTIRYTMSKPATSIMCLMIAR